jgi:hypothetical protein
MAMIENAVAEVLPEVLPPSQQREKELAERSEQATHLAGNLEVQAREWRAVEAACSAALGSLKEGRHG